MTQLILKRAPIGWNQEEYDVARRRRCRRAHFSHPHWAVHGYHEDRTPTHGYEPMREAAMTAFAKSWRREPLNAG
jgi:hypothetical protein